MTDIAALGLSVSSEPVVASAKALDDFAASAGKAEGAAEGLAAADKAMAASLTAMLAELQKANGSLAGIAASSDTTANAMARLEAAVKKPVEEVKKLTTAAEATAPAVAQVATSLNKMDAAAAGARSIKTASDSLKGLNDNSRLASHEVQNLSRQVADVGVSLAGGASPLMVFSQQAAQIGDIMGNRGLSAVIGGVGEAIASLANPTTLTLAGLTAIYYAADAAFSAISGGVKTANDVLEAHDGILKRIAASYPEAAEAAGRYARESATVLTADAQRQIEDERKALDREFKSFAGRYSQFTDPQSAPDLLRAYPEVERFAEILALINAEAQKTRPNVAAVADMIAGVRNEAGDSAEVKQFADGLRDGIKPAADLALALPQTEKAVDGIGGAAERSALSLRRVTEQATALLTAMRGLEGLAALKETPSDQLNRLGQEALRNASGTEERLAANRAIAEARQRIENEQAGALVPRPTRRPSDLDRDEAKSVTKQANALDRLVDSQDATLERMRLERMLIGETDAVRARSLAALEAEQQIRRANIDAGSAEAQQIRERAGAIADERIAIAEQTKALEAWKRARELFKTQQADLNLMQVDAATIRTSSDMRRQALALMQAENDLAQQGIAANSDLGRAVLSNVQALSDYEDRIRRVSDAWDSVRSSGETAIDSLVDGLVGGDLKGALASVATDVSKMLLEISVKNPLKNALLGTDYGTVSDLLDGPGAAPKLAVPQVQSVATMNVASLNVAGGLPLTGAVGALNQLAAGDGIANTNTPMAAYRAAIAAIESRGSGGYAAVGPVTKSGDRAYGKYQMMGANIPEWSMAALGRRVSTSEFMANPTLQDSIFDHRFGGYVNKYGATNAAQAWFGGEGSIGKTGRKDVLGTSVGGYASKFNAELATAQQTLASSAADFTTGFGKTTAGINDKVGAIGGQFAGGFGGVLNSVLSTVASAAGGNGGGVISGLMSLIPGFANGTDSAPGGVAMVGERGPELVNLPRGAQVVPNHALPRMMGGSQSMSVSVGGANITVQGDASEKTLSMIRQELIANNQAQAKNLEKTIGGINSRHKARYA